ncbi:MAG: endonuclease/exonuclease/phosphatase family protein [Candidatus Hydrogenedentota bacterium]
MPARLYAIIITLLFAFPAVAQTYSFPFPPAADHLRVMAWNLEFFNSRVPARTSEQLDDLAQRIIETGAAVIALQEMNQIPALNDLRDHMGNPWAVLTEDFGGGLPQQNAFLYDTSKVTISDTLFVNIHDGVTYPHEWTYRSPVTAVFSHVGDPSVKFRVIGIHGSWQTAEFRDDQGFWLADYVDALVADQNEPHEIILLGDYNGTIPAAPHNGIISGGDLTDVPKRNGDDTTIYPGLKLDYIYGTLSAKDRLSDPTSFVVRPEYYGETGAQFKDTYSDHLPVFVDYRVVDIPQGPTDVVHVDFANYGIQNGASATPWNTLAEALGVVDFGGQVNIKGNTDDSDSSETFTSGQVINQAVTIDALNGSVTVGAPPADPSQPSADESSQTGFVSRP